MPVEGEAPDEAVYGSGEGFAPYDPVAVQPTSTSPAPSSDPGEVGGTSGADSEAPEALAEDLPEFDPHWVDEFTGLLYIGALTDTFEWLGHTFHIRTLTTGELAEVALANKIYVGTESEFKSYQAAVVAACVITVDGQALPAPITTDKGDTAFLNRYRYVMQRWHPPVIDAVYERYYDLEIRVRKVIEAMGNRSG